MKTIQELEKMIAATIKEICDVEVKDPDRHLLSDEIKIPIVDYLYVFDSLEKQLALPVTKVFENNDYTVFTLHNLAQEIYKLQA